METKEIIEYFYPGDDALRRLLLHHSQQVAERCLLIARRHPALDVDEQFLYDAAMLHDIGICRCYAPSIHCHGTEPYIRHGQIGAEMLRSLAAAPLATAPAVAALEPYARVCERHTGTGLPGFEPETLEEQIVCYADKFYSKSSPDRERTVLETAKSLERFGHAGVEKFLDWSRRFE